MNPTLLVLAAGIGSRYGGLKQLDSVGPNGETIIDYSVYDAIRAGFGKIVFIIRRDIEKDFKDLIGSKYSGKIKIDYAFQELTSLPDGFSAPANRKKPWGTGHAILMAKDIIHEAFAVINSDDFYGSESFNILAEYFQTIPADNTTEEYTMVGFKLNNTMSEHGTVARGICAFNDKGHLQTLTETLGIKNDGATVTSDTGQLSGDEIVSMNMWGFRPSLFDHLDSQFRTFLTTNADNMKSEFFIPTVINSLINSGQANVRVLSTSSSWFGVTYREDKPRVMKSIQNMIEQDLYPSPLW